MNKLKKKIFWTLFTILSIFLIAILFIFNFQTYNREKIKIEQNLQRMNNGFAKIPKNENGVPKEDEIPVRKDDFKRFMDVTIYTVLLEEDDDILEIISHTEDVDVEDDVKDIAIKIITKNKQSHTKIGNLYLSDYSYRYEKGNHITLIDNRDVRNRLISSLEAAVLLLALGEIVIAIASSMLSDWIIKPVEESFNKQKQFIADASHELKTPLSVIMACAETLKIDSKEQKWIDNIKTETNRMSKLITSLLDLAKVEGSGDKILYDEVNFSKLVEKSILSFESLAYEKNIKLAYTVEENIRFKCNEEEIGELLSILLDNAVNHSVKKESVGVDVKSEKERIILQVVNKGKPIPKGEEEKIFERFYRVDKARNRNENRYGLGLAIAKGIVEKHNGKISASSTDGYTTFKVIFKK